MGNSFGTRFRVTTWGESHGPGIGAVIDGCPAGLVWDEDYIAGRMARRRPGQSRLTTRREESDLPQVLSGLFEGRTTGTPIALWIPNADARPKDYEAMRDVYRPSHADYTYDAKYGLRDHAGGGRASARETAARVVAGAVAQLLLRQTVGARCVAWVQSVEDLTLEKNWPELDFEEIDRNDVRCPDPELAERMAARIAEARKAGDSLGGVVGAVIIGVPAGLGTPVFDKLHARLAYAMLGINAAKGFEYGSGFAGTRMRGSTHNDPFYADEAGRVRTRTNHSGGVQGGISNGEAIDFRVAFKPVATIPRPQETVDRHGRPAVAEGRGRHDPCVLPRAVPIVEAMAALVVADFLLLRLGDRLSDLPTEPRH